MFPDDFGLIEALAGASIAEGDAGDWNMDGNMTPTLASGSADMGDLNNGGITGLDMATEPARAPPLLPVNDHNLIGFGTPAPGIQETMVNKFFGIELGGDLSSIQDDGFVFAMIDGAMVDASSK
ncbi:hypothetical protein H0H87_001561 [Tephrocybe sp. NHM501043]|nr:hypothetical protein H0H87_001561 [Tephrocybe sp. NHM501043]